jgi:hypothetical protein
VDSLAGRNSHAAFPSYLHAKTSILEEAGIDALGFKGTASLPSLK